MTGTENDFHRILLSISGMMSRDDLKNFKYIVRHTCECLTRTQIDDAETALDVFDMLEKNSIISTCNTKPLENWLEQIHMGKALNLLKTYAPVKPSISEPTLRPGPTNLNIVKIEKHFKPTQMFTVLADEMKRTNFITLKGLLGSGKSQMALKYGCEYTNNHKESTVWKLDCKDLATLQTSLKDLSKELDIQIEKDENKATKESIEVLGKKIVHTLSENNKAMHLLILDDVGKETGRCLQDFIRKCRSSGNFNLIATTFQPLFADSTILEIEGFSPDEAVEFLSEGKKPSEKDKEEYKKLAQRYGFLPLGLMCARTYMRQSYCSPGRFNTLCSTSELCQIEDSHCITDDMEAVLDNKTLFKGLLQFIDILQKNENMRVFDMILSLQFLAIDDIPVLLFDFLPLDIPGANQAMETNNFIQALRKFSFGKIEGEDDGRLLTTHSAFVTALKIFSEQEKKKHLCSDQFSTKERNLLKQLLQAFMYLMDKDNRSPRDFPRNKILASHAKSVLFHADKLFEKDQSLASDLQFLMSMAYVHDLVGYTYNFDGMLNLAAFHSDHAKCYCFVILKINEERTKKQLQEHCKVIESIDQMSDFCKDTANVIFEAMKKVSTENSDTLQKFAKEYIINKHRVEDDISALEEILQTDLENEKQLTVEEYDKLCQRKYAVPINDMAYLFLYELIMATLYTHGRRIFYLVKPVDLQKARLFCSYLFIAYHLGQKASAQYPQYKLLYSMLTERSGTLQQCIDDYSALQQNSIDTFNKVASRCEEMLQENVRFYVFGIFKTDTEKDEHYQAIWLKQLLRCYRNMIRLAKNDDEKEKNR